MLGAERGCEVVRVGEEVKTYPDCLGAPVPYWHFLVGVGAFIAWYVAVWIFI